MIRRFVKYIEPIWVGSDGKPSLRAILAIVFSLDFVNNLNYAIRKWDAGRSLEGLSLTLGIEAGLIVGLLGLSTYQNMQQTINQRPTGTTEQNADQVINIER